MSRGFTATAFAGSIGVHRDTLYQWAKENREFSDALKIARAKQVLHWERRLSKATKNDATPIIFALKNSCPDEWRDVQRHEHTGKDGTPLEAKDAGLQELRAALLERGALLPQSTLIPITHRQ